MEDSSRYNTWTALKNTEWEDQCRHCGACCGALEDPCENLHKDVNGRYCCRAYAQRFGQWHTVSGKELTCIPIRSKIAQGHSWPGDEHCGYAGKERDPLWNVLSHLIK